MNFSIASTDGLLFVLRWIHFFAGITWIGLLYYFNFVQGEFFKEIDANVKNVAFSKLVPRAMAWFRYAALWTWISGVLLITGTVHAGVPLASSWGVLILIGGSLGTLMFLNVWLIIWPNQKALIESATSVLGGGQAIPDAASRAARALQASRTNVLFSIPMLFFMGAARHLILDRDFSAVNFGIVAIVFGAILAILEINAIKGKKLGPLTTIKGVVHCGVALALVMYLLVEVTTR